MHAAPTMKEIEHSYIKKGILYMEMHRYLPLKRNYLLWSTLLIMAFIVAACGQSNGSTSSTNTSGGPTPTTSSTGGNGYGYGSTGTTPTASSSGQLLATKTATVDGKSETILTNAQGLTLYYRTTDAPPSTVCDSSCAQAWPPLVSSGSGTPTSATPLSGKLTVITDANGNQVAYNGHLLYTFASDTAPGQVNGEGVGGIWFVATTNLK